MRRWWYRRFRTRVTPALYNQYADTDGPLMTTEEWERLGGWAGALVAGWSVSRPDWWRRGCTSDVTAGSAEAARARLDEWQDEMAARA